MLFHSPGYKNIHIELESARSNDLPIAIRSIVNRIKIFLIASKGASLQLIKIDKSQEVIGNRKRICNVVKVEVLVIKETDFDAINIFQNLDPEEAENLKFD
ncbi:18367_t:CDS:2 [Funneliformis geosporum]|uniref:18367_t:CDS:1 n=1 Tax=Funneliformis geosporum TaxID=1117311 RepID=A0A9W4X040_9GLOM|nr:18367_t:CDS:2 [Funneliformis geosporum]